MSERQPIAPSLPEDVRRELNRLNRAVVLETDQAKCDAMEARIAELECGNASETPRNSITFAATESHQATLL